MVFEEVHPRTLMKQYIENDKTVISNLFHVVFLDKKRILKKILLILE